jgi:hypothetical protein
MDEPPSATPRYPTSSCSGDCRASARHKQGRTQSAAETQSIRAGSGHGRVIAEERAPRQTAKTLEDPCSETPKDIYFAEKQILRVSSAQAVEPYGIGRYGYGRSQDLGPGTPRPTLQEEIKPDQLLSKIATRRTLHPAAEEIGQRGR